MEATLFPWSVAESGYCVREGWISPQVGFGAERQYFPLQSPALFRKFAAIDGQAKAVDFANQFGLLGIPEMPQEGANLLPVYCERRSSWESEIAKLRHAVELADALRLNSPADLLRFMRWENQVWRYVASREVFQEDVDAFERMQETGRLSPADALTPARKFLCQVINTNLAGRLSAKLCFDSTSGQYSLQMVPSSLRAALWLQLAQGIVERREYRQCKQCGQVFDAGRADDMRAARRIFCSDKCKSADYRGKKDQAQQLRAEGKTAKEIAAALGVDVEMAKRWAKKAK